MPKIRTGVDLVHIPRIKKLIENKHTLHKIFHKSELKHPDPEHLAGIFALKEAFFKALKQKPRWLLIEVTNKPNGAPKIKLSNGIMVKNLISMDYSISHDHEYAIANIVILTR